MRPSMASTRTSWAWASSVAAFYQGEPRAWNRPAIAIRVLRGEPISNFPPKVIGTVGPQYDWRELQRWNISEDRLPPGSVILFRQPTMWEQYRWYVVSAVRTRRGPGGTHRHAARSAPAPPRGPGGATAGRDGRAAPPEPDCSSRPRRRHGPACRIARARAGQPLTAHPHQCAGGEAPAGERRADLDELAIVSRRHRQR